MEKRRALDSTFSAFQLCVGCSVLHDFANPLQARRPACCRVHVPGEPDNGAQHRISRSQGLCLYDNLRQVRQGGNAFLPVPGVFSDDRARESSAFVTSRCARPVLLQERCQRHDHAIAAPRRCHLGRCCSSLVSLGQVHKSVRKFTAVLSKRQQTMSQGQKRLRLTHANAQLKACNIRLYEIKTAGCLVDSN